LPRAKLTHTNVVLSVRDVDATVKKAMAAGVKVVVRVADMPGGVIQDPRGNQWQVATTARTYRRRRWRGRMKAG
jgi:predicted enzyme related to lactoylglutathione lyase